MVDILRTIFMVSTCISITGCASTSPGQARTVSAPVSTGAWFPTPPMHRIARKLTASVVLEIMFHGDIIERVGDTATLRTNNEDWVDRVHVILAQVLETEGATKYIAVTERSAGECHACEAMIGAISFTKVAGGWEMDAIAPLVLYRGTFGHVHSATFARIGQSRYGVLIGSGASYGGDYGTRTDLIAVIGSTWKLIYSGTNERGADRYYTNMECALLRQGCLWGYSTALTFLVGTGDEFYDLQIVQSGVNPGGYTFETRETYTMVNNEYVFQPSR